MAVDADGHIYVADSETNRIQRFYDDGEFILAFGSRGHSEGQFNRISSLFVTMGEEILVVDTNNFRLQLFNLQGKFIRAWGGKGVGPGQTMYPRGGVVSYVGRVYVCDTGNDRVCAALALMSSFLLLSIDHSPRVPFCCVVFLGHRFKSSDEQMFLSFVFHSSCTYLLVSKPHLIN